MLAQPGISGLCVMLNSSTTIVDERRLNEAFAERGWDASKSFVWEEIEEIMFDFTGSALADSNEWISPTATLPAAPEFNETIDSNEGIQPTSTDTTDDVLHMAPSEADPIHLIHLIEFSRSPIEFQLCLAEVLALTQIQESGAIVNMW